VAYIQFCIRSQLSNNFNDGTYQKLQITNISRNEIVMQKYALTQENEFNTENV